MSISTNICRICTIEHLVGAKIPNEHYSADTWNRCFASLVETCAPKLAGDSADSLSETICVICKQEVLRLHRFLTALLKSDALFKRAKQDDEFKSEPCDEEGNFLIDCHNVSDESDDETVSLKPEIVYCEVLESKFGSAFQRDILKTEPFNKDETIEDESDMDIDWTLPEIEEAPSKAIKVPMPEKSKMKYKNAYMSYITWRKKQNASRTTENLLLAYLRDKSQIVKSSTLWSTYSMLKSTINIKEKINIAEFPKIIPFIKRKSIGHNTKESKIFTKEEINRFLTEANDESYLLIKVVLIIGICGACRGEELTNMNIDNVEDKGTIVIFKVPNRKNYLQRTFTITNLEYIDFYRRYRKLRLRHTAHRRLFVSYINEKCRIRPVGKNKIGAMSSLIAKFLKLPNTKAYTGHCFRKSSEKLFANAGA